MLSKSENCSICRNQVGKEKIANGHICTDCLVKCQKFLPQSNLKNITREQMFVAINKSQLNREVLQRFRVTNSIEKFMQVDEVNELWLVPDGQKGQLINPIIYRFDDVISFELLEDGNSETKGSVGSAIAGGILFGNMGTVIGGMAGSKKTTTVINRLEIKITTSSINRPIQYIYLLTAGSVKSGSMLYNIAYSHAQKILSMLSIMQSSRKQEKVSLKDNENVTSVADEVLKLKQLLDMGDITAAEFEKQKEKLLNN